MQAHLPHSREGLAEFYRATDSSRCSCKFCSFCSSQANQWHLPGAASIHRQAEQLKYCRRGFIHSKRPSPSCIRKTDTTSSHYLVPEGQVRLCAKPGSPQKCASQQKWGPRQLSTLESYSSLPLDLRETLGAFSPAGQMSSQIQHAATSEQASERLLVSYGLV